jgi:ATP-dependent DNA ligase
LRPTPTFFTALFTAALIARSSSTRIGVDGYSDFNALHSGGHNEEVQFCAFDVLAMDGDDLRYLPLSMWKANSARLLARRPDGIFLSDFECEIGPDLFVAACRMGLEGLVSKHRDRPTDASIKAPDQGQKTASIPRWS